MDAVGAGTWTGVGVGDATWEGVGESVRGMLAAMLAAAAHGG